MTPAKQAKEAGLKSLSHASEVSGVSTRTLTNWHKTNNWLFTAVIEKVARDDSRRNSNEVSNRGSD